MDNLAHSLIGATLAQTDLKRLTGLGTATLVIGANLPDLDAFGLLVGENLAWRRGLTHGPLGLLFLPLLLALGVVAFDRWQARRGTRPKNRLPVRWGGVLFLAYLGALSHPLLDWLNVYGVRLLMPFSERWFYGDILFIVDPWLWILLSAGILLTVRREKRGSDRPGLPAVVVLVAVAAYCGAMAVAGRGAEAHVARVLAAAGEGTARRILASPTAANPFVWDILIEKEGGYAFGELLWSPWPRLTLWPDMVSTNMDHPLVVAAARQDKRIADFLCWSRFPFAAINKMEGRADVFVGDARYSRMPQLGPFGVRANIPIQK